MPEYFESIKKIVSVSIPASSRTWPAASGSGCNSTVTRYSARTVNAPASTRGIYEPFIEFTSRSAPVDGRTRSYPPYRATPEWIRTVRTRNFLLTRRAGTNGYNCHQQTGSVRKVGQTCTAVPSGVTPTGPLTAEWWEQTKTNNWDEFTVSSFDESLVADAIETVKNDVALEALTCYDALTELAEMREIPSTIRSASKTIYSVLTKMAKTHGVEAMRLSSKMTPRKLLRHASKALRRLGSDWMTYRYGIMPVIYSYRDLVKLTERGVTMTKRKSIMLHATPSGVLLPPPTANYRWKAVEGSVIVRGNVWQHFTSESMAKLGGTGFNPLVTLWELTPWSFVADWVLNVGDYITRKTTPLISDRIESTISRRTHLFTRTYVHFKDDSYDVTFGNVLSDPWYGEAPPATPSKRIQRPEESQLWKEIEVDEYQRFVVSVRDVQLRPSVSLNWKRGIDAAVMASSLLRDVLRRLR